MKERVVISRSGQRGSAERKEFAFVDRLPPGTAYSTGTPDFIRDFRNNAFSTYNELRMPTVNDEPWRRTDLRGLPVEKFILPIELDRSKAQLSEPPKALLEPLTGNKHGGQIILTANQTRIDLDPILAQKGVIFTDIKTAQSEHPQILEKILEK